MQTKRNIFILIICLCLLTGCTKNELALKVGFIYPGSSQDEGINQMQEVACNNLVDYFNGKVQTISKSSITADNIESVIYDMVNSGVSIIFISSNEFDEQIQRAATAYENIDFVIYNGTLNLENVKNYFARQYEADYLCGVVAGNTTSKIGYLAPNGNNENLIHINAFALGVNKSNPDATIDLIYTGNNASTSRLNGAVSRLINNGCDLIATCLRDNTALIEASNNGVKVIGSSPSGIENSDNYLTSMELNLTDFYINEISNVLNGTFDNSTYTGTVYDNFIELDDFTYNVSEKTKRETNSTIEAMKKGNITVFTGPIVTNDGVVVAEEGKVLSEVDLQNMNYLLSNVRLLNN